MVCNLSNLIKKGMSGLTRNTAVFSFRRKHTKLYEPDYLESSKPKFPQYDALNIRFTGYDFPVLEHFQKYTHSVLEAIGVSVDNGWAMPAKQHKVIRYKPQSTVVESQFKILEYQRYLKIVNVPATTLSIVLEIIQRTLPPGVKMDVHPFGEYHETDRYIPNLELRDLRIELEELGGPPDDPNQPR